MNAGFSEILPTNPTSNIYSNWNFPSEEVKTNQVKPNQSWDHRRLDNKNNSKKVKYDKGFSVNIVELNKFYTKTFNLFNRMNYSDNVIENSIILNDMRNIHEHEDLKSFKSFSENVLTLSFRVVSFQLSQNIDLEMSITPHNSAIFVYRKTNSTDFLIIHIHHDRIVFSKSIGNSDSSEEFPNTEESLGKVLESIKYYASI